MVMTDILMNGLEGAGQTTILEKLDPGKVFTQIIVMGIFFSAWLRSHRTYSFTE